MVLRFETKIERGKNKKKMLTERERERERERKENVPADNIHGEQQILTLAEGPRE